jgi:hypothetical protein
MRAGGHLTRAGRSMAMLTRAVHMRFLTEADPDGFRTFEPEFTGYCALEGCKLGPETHAECHYFSGYMVDEHGAVIGIECRRPAAERHCHLCGGED